MLIGFPTDLRDMQEISHDISLFGRLLVWDRLKTTDVAAVVKVRVSALEDVLASVVVSGGTNPMSETRTCPMVIF